VGIFAAGDAPEQFIVSFLASAVDLGSCRSTYEWAVNVSGRVVGVLFP